MGSCCSLLVRWSFACLWASMRWSPSVSLLFLVPSWYSLQGGFLFLGSVLLLFREWLVWIWVSGPSCLSVVFADGVSLLCFCSILGLRFLPQVPHLCCSQWLSLSPFLLSLRPLPSWTYISLWRLYPLLGLLLWCFASVLMSLSVSLRSLRAASSVATPGPTSASAFSVSCSHPS